MYHALYNTLLAFAAPILKVGLALHPRHRLLRARFAPDVPSEGRNGAWLHACSVGEVMVARSIAEALRQRWPGAPLLLTASTAAGYAHVDPLPADMPKTWCPVDTLPAVRRFLDRLEPRILLLTETELWPNLLRESHRRGIPVAIVNARISDYHYPRYRWLRPLLAPLLRDVTAVMAQSETHGERFAELGVPPERIHVTGNTKFDGAPAPFSQQARASLRAQCGAPPGAPVLVFGSTHPGDEALAAACYARLRGEQPDLRLIVAPRHPTRIDDAIAPFEGAAALWSELKEAGPSQASEKGVLMVDTIGELNAFYSVADVAVIGGSFDPAVGGHNPIEPAAQGAPVVFGPEMANAQEAAHVLTEAGAGIQVADEAGLAGELARLLRNPRLREEMGERGLAIVEANRGATSRILDLIEPYVT